MENAKPSGLWYLVPLFFGVVGGIVAYVGVKDEDEEMAKFLLSFVILWGVVLKTITFAVYLS